METRKKLAAGELHGSEARSKSLLIQALGVDDVHGVEAALVRRSARHGRGHGVGALTAISAVFGGISERRTGKEKGEVGWRREGNNRGRG